MQNEDQTGSNGWSTFLNPIVVIALLILFSVFVLIGAAIIGLDKGVLAGMAKIEFARGLITYLFAVVTIGTAVGLIVSALTGVESEAHEKRFQRGKEILSLLLGVFGTIVGFYFGSEAGQKAPVQERAIHLAQIHPNPLTVGSGGQVSVETFVFGGKAPYKYAIGFGSDPIAATELVDQSGWISKTVSAPKVSSEEPVQIRVVAVDSDGNKVEESRPIVVKP